MVGRMTPHRAPLLLWGAVLGSFVPGALCGPPSHSLLYFYLQEPEPSQGLPLYFIRGYLDDQPIARYDSLTGKMEPLLPWMEEVEKERFQVVEWVFGADLEKLSELSHQTGGLHTWQAIWGCELREDGSKGGFFHYGYNGGDFISFDKETLRWVAAQPQAQKVKEKWDDDPGWSKRNKAFLEKTCIEWLQRYLSYKNKTQRDSERLRETQRDSENKRTATTWWIPVGIVAAVILGLGILFLICRWWRCRKNVSQQAKSCSHHIPSEMADFPPVRGTEDQSQPQTILQTKITVEPKTSCGAWELWSVLRATLPTSSRQEGRQQSLRRWNSWAGDPQALAEAGATESAVRMIKEPVESLGSLFQGSGDSEGFHSSWSGISCELSEDGHKPGGDQNLYDVEDFISFDWKSCTWARDEVQTPVTNKKWEAEPKLRQQVTTREPLLALEEIGEGQSQSRQGFSELVRSAGREEQRQDEHERQKSDEKQEPPPS